MAKAEVLEKERRATELALAKVPYEEIAKVVGYANGGGAHKAVMRCLKRQSGENVKEMRMEQLATLDLLQRAFMPHALSGNEKAGALIIKIIETRDRYVPQLLVPTEITSNVNVTVTRSEWESQVDEWAAQFEAERASQAEQVPG